MSTPAEIFIQSCRKVFSCWTALNLAVENHWGGADSESKRESLVQQIINLCISRKEVSRDEIEEILVDKLDRHFCLVLEDGSDTEVAEILVKLHSSCTKGDFAYAKELVERLERCNNSHCVAAPNDGPEGGQEDEEEDEDDHHGPDAGHTANSGAKSRHRGKRTAQEEDGWTKVL